MGLRRGKPFPLRKEASLKERKKKKNLVEIKLHFGVVMKDFNAAKLEK